MTIHNLQKLFEPNSVAVIGASSSERSVGATLLRNVLQGFQGRVFAVNPNRDSVLGRTSYPDVGAIPEPIDVAIIATPASTVPSIVEECGKAGISAVIIISAGFSEAGIQGEKLQEKIEAGRKKYGMRILGPNCLGFIRPPARLNLSFAREVPSPGGVAFISQSGAMGSSLIDWATESRIGFSAFVSIGNTLDIGFADLIDYYGQDPSTKSIILYLETLEDPEAFIRAARPFARRKPIICLKGGRHPQSQSLVSSHIGLSPRRNEVYDALFKRVGITRVRTLEDLFACSEILAHEPLPEGPNLAVVTNANGPAILALDTLLDQGGRVATFHKETRQKLGKLLPPQANPGNPLDVLGDAGSTRYEKCGRVVSEDGDVDALLVIYCPQGEAPATDAAEAVVEVVEDTEKPVLTAWIGGKEAREGRKKLRDNGIVTCTAPEQAAKAYLYLYQYVRNLEMLYQTPEQLEFSPTAYSIPKHIKKDIEEGITKLSETETRKLLRAYDINPLDQKSICSVSEAKEFASTAGFPLTLKGDRGWKLTVNTWDQLESALSRMVGSGSHQNNQLLVREKVPEGSSIIRLNSYRDSLFGSLIMVNPTRENYDVKVSNIVGFPPLNQVLARRLLEEAGIERLLKNLYRDPPHLIRELERTLASFSQLLIDYPEIVEINIPRLVLAEEKLRALGTEVTLGPAKAEKDERPHSHMIISPYPERYVSEAELKDGRSVTIRPIRPEDEPLEVELFDTFSERTWRERFFSSPQAVTHRKMSTFTNIDYRREMAIVGILKEGGEEKMMGMARLIVDPTGEKGEYAIVVGDPWQGLGLGRELTEALVEWAQDMDLYSIYEFVRVENKRMINFSKHMGFRVVGQSEDMIKMNYPL
ncbi:GNAT family N-acetyltransferase [Candidatus Bipolaricaulota bacterium]|nr:GNAT family N-acetyltransferase [Candidatus Bipolaricaulota bacterium]MCF7890177.1 GNAT family N-acetyltransferase [Candidatus Bipolaricaulota bacterium]